jgi:hypothetical protein
LWLFKINRKEICKNGNYCQGYLLKLITKNSPTYGNRPAAVAYLHSMLDGKFKIFESITFLCWCALCNFIFNDTTYRMSETWNYSSSWTKLYANSKLAFRFLTST